MAVKSTVKTNKVEEDTQSALLRAAKTLFSAQGYDGATVKEISEAAGVNVGLISYFFGGKEGLYRACLADFGSKNLKMAERTLEEPRSHEEIRVRLKMFFGELTEAHLAEPEVTTILHRECDMDFPYAQELFRDSFLKVFERFIHFIKKAEERGLTRPGIDPFVLAQLCFSGIIHAFRTDRLAEQMFGFTLRNEEYRARFLKHHLDACLLNLGVPL